MIKLDYTKLLGFKLEHTAAQGANVGTIKPPRTAAGAKVGSPKVGAVKIGIKPRAV